MLQNVTRESAAMKGNGGGREGARRRRMDRGDKETDRRRNDLTEEEGAIHGRRLAATNVNERLRKMTWDPTSIIT